MNDKKTLTLKCGHCNGQFNAEVADGRIDAKCKCGLRHTGSAEAWGSIRCDTIRLQAPLTMFKRLAINLE